MRRFRWGGCYAERLAATRLKHHSSRKGLTRHGRWTGEVRFNRGWLDQPRSWRAPKRIFACAHSDLFHEAVPFGWVMQVLRVMFETPRHAYQVLTKRPERMRYFMQCWGDVTGENFATFHDARGPDATGQAHSSPRGQLFADMLEAMGDPPPGCAHPTFDWMGGMLRWPGVPPNVWLGTSVEDQRAADERIPVLLGTPAAVRWISAEPLLGPIDLKAAGHDLPKLDWVVCGGESGPRARPMDPAWARSLRDDCAECGVPFFFKQWGGIRAKAGGRLLDGREHGAMPAAWSEGRA